MIVRERYTITKNTNMTYEDTGSMTPIERDYILQFITDDLKLKQEQMEESQRDARANKANAKRPARIPVSR